MRSWRQPCLVWWKFHFAGLRSWLCGFSLWLSAAPSIPVDGNVGEQKPAEHISPAAERLLRGFEKDWRRTVSEHSKRQFTVHFHFYFITKRFLGQEEQEAPNPSWILICAALLTANWFDQKFLNFVQLHFMMHKMNV